MATTTKCLSKMNKKELYEHCKKLTNENQKLQLFNNAQEQEIEQLKEEIKELQALYPHSQKEYIDIARNYSFNIQNDYICGDNPNRPRLFNANNELKICKENQCPKGELFSPFINIIIHRDNEIKQLEQYIEELQQNQSFEMVENLTEELAKKEDIIIKLEKEIECMERQLLEEKDKVDINFLKKYIVPNWYLPEHLGVEEEEVEDFKDFVRDWATGGWAMDLNDTMEELLENFRKGARAYNN